MDKNIEKRQQEMIEMINTYYNLPRDKQMFISGMIQGLSVEKNIEPQIINA